ncbi:MAG TPA: hypothetical protein VGX76_08485, partial [Pirellulales bacterium]|nr:hypothetical protein [Pirellulales bacterium]
LQHRWMTAAPNLTWEEARFATRDAWDRMATKAIRLERPSVPASDLVPELRAAPHAGHPSTARADDDHNRPGEHDRSDPRKS